MEQRLGACADGGATGAVCAARVPVPQGSLRKAQAALPEVAHLRCERHSLSWLSNSYALSGAETVSYTHLTLPTICSV
eukprot:3327346-Rhodomonas_salina.1